MPVRIVNGVPVMDAARLRHRVLFLEPTPGTDDSGSTVTWAAGNPPDIAWAEIVPTRGSDIIRAGQDVSQVWITVTLRYNPSKTRTPNTRLQAPSGSIFVVQAIENVLEMNVWLVMTCLGLGANQ